MDVCAEHVSLKYEKKLALQDISVTMRNGLYALLGPNGSGKSSFLRVLSGIECGSEGKVLLGNKDVRENKMSLGYLPQNPGLFLDYTVENYLLFIGTLKALRPIVTRMNMDYWLDFFDLKRFSNVRIGRLSTGNQQKIGIIQALLNDPAVLILDEPTSNLDPAERRRVLRLFTKLAETKTIIYSTQVIEEVDHIAPHLLILRDGRLIYNGETERIGEKVSQEFWITKMTEERYASLGHEEELSCVKEGQFRIVENASEEKPCPDSLRIQPGLSDYYLYLTSNANARTR
ncbi:MAG: ABC transporter ATP-binding protein [Chordicoccus sp.]